MRASDQQRNAPEWMLLAINGCTSCAGPSEEMRVLATAVCPKTMAHEPVLWTVKYGEGRAVQTPIGHDVFAMRCVGFAAAMLRSVEWAATGTVAIPTSANFPAAAKTSRLPEKKK